MSDVMSDILKKIEAYKREEIARAKKARPRAKVEAAAEAASPVRGFFAAAGDDGIGSREAFDARCAVRKSGFRAQ